MKVRNDYNNCLTNLVSSFSQYFGVKPYHTTLSYVDQILEDKKPKNVVLILLDGMGSKIIENVLPEDSFLRSHMIKEISSVFPATTTAATTSAQTGLNPVEHCWLGWNTYLKPLDKIITLFLCSEKETNNVDKDFIEMLNDFSPEKITDKVKKVDGCYGLEVSPYSNDENCSYRELDDMFKIVERETKRPEKTYMYVYNNDPDATMHKTGVYSTESINAILTRQKKVEELCGKLKDTLVFVIADHGHIDCQNIYLRDYPEIAEMLERDTSIEPRATALKVKPQYIDVFKQKFNQQLSKYFTLYDAQDVIDSQLFGQGEIHEYFRDAIGDYLAIAQDCPYCLMSDTDYDKMKSAHAGYTDEEIYVPLIMIDCM